MHLCRSSCGLPVDYKHCCLGLASVTAIDAVLAALGTAMHIENGGIPHYCVTASRVQRSNGCGMLAASIIVPVESVYVPVARNHLAMRTSPLAQLSSARTTIEALGSTSRFD